MQIVIIGSGNVAFHLAKAFTEKNITIKQIFGRNKETLQEFQQKLNIPTSTEKIAYADLYIICVSDSSVAEVSKLIPNENALVAHTSGALPIKILEGNYRKSSFYPLQTFSKNKTLDYSKIPFFIETEYKEDFDILENLAKKISKNIDSSTYEKRKHIHLAAVFSCNFVNHLFAQAKEILDNQNIPFKHLVPLIEETVEKINHLTPKEAQTGPAVRNDTRILELHEKLLTDETKKKLYKTLNSSIKKMHSL